MEGSTLPLILNANLYNVNLKNPKIIIVNWHLTFYMILEGTYAIHFFKLLSFSTYSLRFSYRLEFPRWLNSKESARQCRSCGFDPYMRKIPWRRKWNPPPPIQYFCLWNPMDRGARWATAHGVTKQSDTT